jgi:hypothetical protein
MERDRLIDVVERWEETDWFDKKYIWWICIKQKYQITSKKVISLATILMILMVLKEPHRCYMTGLLSTIVLFHFYILFADCLLNKGKITS